MGKIRSEPLRWPDRDSRVLALHELIPNLNSIFLFIIQWWFFAEHVFDFLLCGFGLKFIEKYPTGLARRKEDKIY